VDEKFFLVKVLTNSPKPIKSKRRGKKHMFFPPLEEKFLASRVL
jgi:hypothetical protein